MRNQPSRKDGGVRLGVVAVAVDDARAAHADLADLADGSACQSSSRIAISVPVATPTVPGRRSAGGSGFEAIWCAASVIP